jgi:hypothetical protein
MNVSYLDKSEFCCSLTNVNPDTKLLEEKTQMIEKNTALLEEKDKLLAEKERKLETERKRAEQEQKKNAILTKKLESTQEELMKTQIKYQKEIEKLEKENKELRKQLLLRNRCSIFNHDFISVADPDNFDANPDPTYEKTGSRFDLRKKPISLSCSIEILYKLFATTNIC